MLINFLLFLELVAAIFDSTTDNLSLKVSSKRDSLSSQAKRVMKMMSKVGVITYVLYHMLYQ